MSDQTDQTVTCCEAGCARPFVITAGENQYFVENNLQLPRRCRECRARRKAERGGVAPAPVPAPPVFQEALPSRNKGRRPSRDQDDFGDYKQRRR